MRKDSISKKQLREFGFIIGLGLLLIIRWIIPSINGYLFLSWSLFLGGILLIIGILKPRLLFYPYKLWTYIGFLLGWINSRLILGLIFIIILQPIALVMKIVGYDPLKKSKNNQISYRENKEGHKVNLTKIF